MTPDELKTFVSDILALSIGIPNSDNDRDEPESGLVGFALKEPVDFVTEVKL
jgi:hypothetical protein